MSRKKMSREESDKRMRRTMIRNWIIMLVSLAAMVICYYYVK